MMLSWRQVSGCSMDCARHRAVPGTAPVSVPVPVTAADRLMPLRREPGGASWQWPGVMGGRGLKQLQWPGVMGEPGTEAAAESGCDLVLKSFSWAGIFVRPKSKSPALSGAFAGLPK